MFSKIFYSETPEIAEQIWYAIAAVSKSTAYQDLLVSGECAD
jgi:hypothetical protein